MSSNILQTPFIDMQQTPANYELIAMQALTNNEAHSL